jgi:chemotaxis signal transduction protein
MSAITSIETHVVSGTASSAKSGEFHSFRIGAEEYGIDILKVQEIGVMKRRRGSRTRPHS